MIDNITATIISEKYYNNVYSYCLSSLNWNETEASEVTQRVFEVFCEKCGELENDNILKWLYGVAWNKVMEHHREEQKAYNFLSVEDELTCEQEEEFFSLLDEYFPLDDETIQKHKEVVLKSLSQKEKLLYNKRFVENKDVKQVALEFGITENAVRLREARLRKKVEKLVKLTLTTMGQFIIKIFF